MAIIACKECGHQVSDKAASCPNCGAPVAAPLAAPASTVRRRPRVLSGVLLSLAVVCIAGLAAETVWLIKTLYPAGSLHTLLQLPAAPRPAPVIIKPKVTLASSPPAPLARPVYKTPAPPARPVYQTPAPPARPVYQTTAEQLYRDYERNEVAIQGTISPYRVRVTGSVAEIDEDASGHPVVKLSTGRYSRAAMPMTLTDDQRDAAAQLVRGQMVEIECEKMTRNGAAPQGSDCTLLLINAPSTPVRSTPVYLALFMFNDSGPSRVYVMGPMSESECLSRSGTFADRMSTGRGERVAFKNCTSTAPADIPPEGCRRTRWVTSVADIPAAHLWRYDCTAPALAAARHLGGGSSTPAIPAPVATAEAAAKEAPTHAARLAAETARHEEETAEPEDTATTHAVPVAAETAKPAPLVPSGKAKEALASGLASVPAPHPLTATPRTLAIGTSAVGKKTLVARAEGTETPAAHLSATRKGTAPTAAAAPGKTHAPRPPAAPDVLAVVRAKDPKAAEHIASYCSRTYGSSSQAAQCRRQEMEAWTRLVLQNEFPHLDEATRRKCSQPPFPDTYVAKEICARYELHLD